MSDDTSDERVGRRLKALRMSLGLGITEMAEANNIDATNYGRFEKGKRPLPLAIGKLLAQRYDVTMDWLYLGRWGGLSLDVAERLRKFS